MEPDEIRARISDARRACAEVAQADFAGAANTPTDAGNESAARSPVGRANAAADSLDRQATAENIARLSAALERLADAAEWILTEREAIADRLRRTPRVRPRNDTLAASSADEFPDAASSATPSPAQDA
ncbi:MAG TPA: hypothetical protein VFE47_09050 [Tepidisphaeraceae bacterium]|jgi:hypothetical protein|nr:hypothetical protein [Tepidisphaeraceae bacterium]